MENELHKFIDELGLPQATKEDLKKKYSDSSPNPEAVNSKKTVSLSSEDGRKVMIVLWADETVTIISTNDNGEPHISSAQSPDMYHIAMKNYIDLGLHVEHEAS